MRNIAFSLGVIALLAMPPTQVSAQQHGHPASAPATRTTPAHRYATDTTLREQMRAIRTEVAALENTGSGSAVAHAGQAGADRMIGHVNTIITNCRLPPDADAALHKIIGPILQDASTLKSQPTNAAAIAGIRQALERYAWQFDDPGFSDSTE